LRGRGREPRPTPERQQYIASQVQVRGHKDRHAISGKEDALARMTARDPAEPHRAATPLELFFDLVFVVAIAQASSELHHALVEARVAEGLLSYGMVFFAIWWAWMNFTWFASAYDPDDLPYRLTVFVQITGSLILAAGIPRAFETHDFAIATAGYVVMRLALVGQWLRAARSDPLRARCARRYALGIAACQTGWVGLLFTPSPLSLPGFFGLVLAELLVPAWAERCGGTTWHPGHIVERYGLFTIIVLGESILAASIAIQSAIHGGATGLAGLVTGGLLVVFSMWWLYFYRPMGDLLTTMPRAFLWGYGHLVVFAAGTAVGAGLGVAVDEATGHAAIGARGAAAAVAIPVAAWLLALWLIHHVIADEPAPASGWVPPVAGLVLLSPWTGQPVLVIGVLLAGLVAVKLIRSAPS
jgi:low temperature requirement protein LtrA